MKANFQLIISVGFILLVCFLFAKKQPIAITIAFNAITIGGHKKRKLWSKRTMDGYAQKADLFLSPKPVASILSCGEPLLVLNQIRAHMVRLHKSEKGC